VHGREAGVGVLGVQLVGVLVQDHPQLVVQPLVWAWRAHGTGLGLEASSIGRRSLTLHDHGVSYDLGVVSVVPSKAHGKALTLAAANQMLKGWSPLRLAVCRALCS
jgi:hypothetical protein